MKEAKIVVRDLRKDISKDLMKGYEEEYPALTTKEIKQENEEVEASEVKKDPDENLFWTYEKMPRKKEILTMEVKASRRTTKSNHQCEICQKYFSSNQRLQQHINFHFKPSMFKCESKCRRTFVKKNNLENHICFPSSTCLHCSLTLKVGYLRRHMKNVHKIQMITDGFTCDYCGDCFKRKVNLLNHFRRQACEGRSKFFCDHCDKNFIKKRKIRNHILTHTIYKVECKVCHLMLRTNSLMVHMQRYHPKKEEQLECQKCSKTFNSLSRLKDHLMFHNKKFQCSVCDKKFPNHATLKAHMKFHENPEQLQCQICGLQSTTKGSLKVHLKTHDKNREKHLKCNRCDFKTHEKRNFSIHFKFHEKLDEKMKKYPNSTKCEKCPSVLLNRKQYLIHLKRKHANRKRFQCDFCDKTLVKKKDIKRHLLKKHFKV